MKELCKEEEWDKMDIFVLKNPTLVKIHVRNFEKELSYSIKSNRHENVVFIPSKEGSKLFP